MDWMDKPQDVQGSKAWHNWRATGIGASEASVIMNCSPWMTPYQLWLEKTGQKMRDPAGFAAQRGTRLEPIVRKKFENLMAPLMEKFNNHFPPKSFSSGIINASLDGWNEYSKQAVEIKCPGEKTHKEALKNKKPPEHYWWQIQHQYFSSGAKNIFYCSYWVAENVDEQNGEIIYFPVEKDDQAIKRYLVEAKKFWEHVETNTPPPFTDRDVVDLDENACLSKLMDNFKDLTSEFSIAKAKLDLCKKEIIKQCTSIGYAKMKCNGIRATLISKKGSIDYSKVPIEANIDIEQYRKKGSSYWKIEEIKKND